MSQSNTAPLDLVSAKKVAARKPLIGEPQLTAFFLIIPALIIFVVFVVWPIIQTAHYSAYKWTETGQLTDYIGLDNYTRLLADPIFWRAFGNNLFVVGWSLVTQIPLAMFLAILLTGKIKGSAFFRTLYFAPLVLSDVLIGAIWGWFYNPTIGMLNTALKFFHLPTQAWLGDPKLALICVLVATTWRYLGFYIVIYIAAIQGISEELYEAAEIDGANGFQLHRFITIPLLIPTTRASAVLMIIGSLKFFDMVWFLTEGGPSNSSELIATYMFKQAFKFHDWSYGSALAFALFVIAFIFTVIFLFFTRKREQSARGAR
jgi:raffinose/stachyose/melibiose transport system permease protein